MPESNEDQSERELLSECLDRVHAHKLGAQVKI